MAITKVSAQGEQLVIDVSQWNGVTGEIVHKDITEMSELFNQAMDIADSRLYEMNMRMLEARNVRKYFDSEHWTKLVAIFDVLAGRVDITTVTQRWDDAIEENRELAEMREVAYSTKGTHSICDQCGEKGGYHTLQCSLSDPGKNLEDSQY